MRKAISNPWLWYMVAKVLPTGKAAQKDKAQLLRNCTGNRYTAMGISRRAVKRRLVKCESNKMAKGQNLRNTTMRQDRSAFLGF